MVNTIKRTLLYGGDMCLFGLFVLFFKLPSPVKQTIDHTKWIVVYYAVFCPFLLLVYGCLFKLYVSQVKNGFLQHTYDFFSYTKSIILVYTL